MGNSEKYKKYFTDEYLMGPNSIRILEELLETFPLQKKEENKILDLGCGTGLTSLYLAKETKARIYAVDLWVKEDENRKRFQDWKMEERMIPLCRDANNLEFEKGYFHAVVSVDGYHYFGGKEGFFTEKILPLVENDGMVLLAVPGIQEEYEGKQEEVFGKWVGGDAYMFHSPSWWKNIIGQHPSIEFVRTWELKSFSLAWKEWLQMDNEFAKNDRIFFESTIKKYSNFVGIAVKKK